MSFTSSSSNKNNKFRVVVKKEEFIITIEECAVYTIVQKVPLLFPVIYKAKRQAFQQPSRTKANRVECLDVKRVLAHCCKRSRNMMQLLLESQPKTIIDCKIFKSTLQKKHIPLPYKKSALAILDFYYDVELIYEDFWGNTHTIRRGSGPRRQRVVLNTPFGNLNVQLQLSCLNLQLNPAILAEKIIDNKS